MAIALKDSYFYWLKDKETNEICIGRYDSCDRNIGCFDIVGTDVPYLTNEFDVLAEIPFPLGYKTPKKWEE